jgi:hypothetical protein
VTLRQPPIAPIFVENVLQEFAWSGIAAKLFSSKTCSRTTICCGITLSCSKDKGLIRVLVHQLGGRYLGTAVWQNSMAPNLCANEY